ncbi:trafficking regulator of GLUT4 1-like [Ostrea edulis]|uniref:trafficking regulator of GLUT4 1-like n=1 Tax=Ostrea edulis TaxID=37623 RepID=UPI0020959645|nr:trafficking regulator of GLUT4 1-like [Ostrea edulis]
MNTATPYNAGYDQGQTSYQSGPPGYMPHQTTKNYGCTPVHAIRYKPTNWLCPAIFSCLFCFWPVGLAAIYYAVEANQRSDRNDTYGAERSANCARNLTITSVVIGVVTLVVMLALFFTGAFVMNSNVHHPS